MQRLKIEARNLFSRMADAKREAEGAKRDAEHYRRTCRGYQASNLNPKP